MKAHRNLWALRPWSRHGLILVVAGFMYAMVGVSYILASKSVNRLNSLEILLRIAPLSFWGSVFIVAGVLAMISSRWPTFSETWGYMVLTGLSAGWGSTYLMGILFGNAPWTNVNGFIVWGLLGFFLWGVSGLVNPEKVVIDESRPA
jgi:hypothetical protein